MRLIVPDGFSPVRSVSQGGYGWIGEYRTGGHDQIRV